MFIESITLQNFKSFEKAHIRLVRGINGLAGPNGSGKSNICDAISFALGENSLKKLRVNSLKDLIHRNKNFAKVSLILRDDNNAYEIVRIVTKNNVKYYLNGKRIKLKELKEFKAQHGLSNSGRAVIAQGEIRKIIRMRPEERRIFIEEVAGTSEYERKKEEALKELEIVANRIKETNLILGEKLKHLEELKKEKERANAYIKLRKALNNIKYTIAKRSQRRLENRLNYIKEEKQKLKNNIKEKEEALESITKKIDALFKDKKMLDEELQNKTKHNELFKNIEETKAKIKILREKISIKEDLLINLSKEIKALKNQQELIEKEAHENKRKSEEAKRKAESIKIEKQRQEEEQINALTEEIESLKQTLSALEKQKILLNSKAESLRSIIETMQSQLKEEKIEVVSEDIIKKQLKDLEEKIAKSFSKESQLNTLLAEKDKALLKIKEKIALLKASSSFSESNTYLIIEELRKANKIEGIYGRVIDLIDFPSELAKAVEAAGGGRLTYFVVDKVDTAKKIIDYLKNIKAGRASFIPLDTIRTPVIREESLPHIKSFVSIQPGLEKVIDFVFGNTLLAKSFDEAKAFAGKKRVATLSGELFEESGVIIGGAGKRSITSSKVLKNMGEELEVIMNERSSILNQIRELRDHVSKLRTEKAKLEERLSEIIKNKERIQKEQKEKEKIKNEIDDKKKKLEEIKQEIITINNKINEKSVILNKKENERKAILKKFKIEMEEKEKELTKNVSLKAMLIERTKQLLSKFNEQMNQLESIKQNLNNKLKEKETLEKEIRELEDELRFKEGELSLLEEQFKENEKLLDGLLKRIDEREQKLQELGSQQQLLTKEKEKLEKKLNQLSIEEASIKATYENINQTLHEIGEAIELSDHTPKLERELKEIEEKLAEMKDINFSAEKLYNQLFDEVGEVKERIDKLKNEKQHIIELIGEIDKKKREVFKKTVEYVSQKMRDISKEIKNFGQAFITLTSNDLDKAGITLHVMRETAIPLESLSGGEQALLSLIFLFAMQLIKPSPFYIFDEVDASLDKLNSAKLVEFMNNINKHYGTQFLVVSHRDEVLSHADVLIGVSKYNEKSKLVEIKFKN